MVLGVALVKSTVGQEQGAFTGPADPVTCTRALGEEGPPGKVSLALSMEKELSYPELCSEYCLPRNLKASPIRFDS